MNSADTSWRTRLSNRWKTNHQSVSPPHSIIFWGSFLKRMNSLLRGRLMELKKSETKSSTSLSELKLMFFLTIFIFLETNPSCKTHEEIRCIAIQQFKVTVVLCRRISKVTKARKLVTIRACNLPWLHETLLVFVDPRLHYFLMTGVNASCEASLMRSINKIWKIFGKGSCGLMLFVLGSWCPLACGSNLFNCWSWHFLGIPLLHIFHHVSFAPCIRWLSHVDIISDLCFTLV